MELLSFAILGILIVISPGADFVLVFKNSLNYGRKAGVLTAVGVAAGVCFHVGYSIVGIGHLISQNEVFFNLIKYAGAAYLIYLGVTGLLTKPLDLDNAAVKELNASSANYLVQGFLCNVLNPKTMLFFLSVFSQLISIDNNNSAFIISYGLYIVVLHGVWFCTVAMCVTSPYLLTVFQRFSKQINQVCSAGLIAFGTLLSL